MERHERGLARKNKAIPVKLTEEEFNEFILPFLWKGKRGPKPKIPLYKIFNYILKVDYTGIQWKELPIELGPDGKPEIHYTNIFKRFDSHEDFKTG